MKIPLYLVAMRCSSGSVVTWITTSEFDKSADVVRLDEFEFEYEVKQPEEEIEALLAVKKVSEIDTLEKRLRELKA